MNDTSENSDHTTMDTEYIQTDMNKTVTAIGTTHPHNADNDRNLMYGSRTPREDYATLTVDMRASNDQTDMNKTVTSIGTTHPHNADNDRNLMYGSGTPREDYATLTVNAHACKQCSHLGEFTPIICMKPCSFSKNEVAGRHDNLT